MFGDSEPRMDFIFHSDHHKSERAFRPVVRHEPADSGQLGRTEGFLIDHIIRSVICPVQVLTRSTVPMVRRESE